MRQSYHDSVRFPPKADIPIFPALDACFAPQRLDRLVQRLPQARPGSHRVERKTRVSPIPPLRAIGAVYVELFRNIPLLSLLILVAYGLPYVGVTFSLFTTAVAANRKHWIM